MHSLGNTPLNSALLQFVRVFMKNKILKIHNRELCKQQYVIARNYMIARNYLIACNYKIAQFCKKLLALACHYKIARYCTKLPN